MCCGHSMGPVWGKALQWQAREFGLYPSGDGDPRVFLGEEATGSVLRGRGVGGTSLETGWLKEAGAGAPREID